MKGKSISVTGRLTKKGMEALKKAREDHGFENVWSSEKKILYKDVSERNKIKVYFDYTLYFKLLLKTINGKKLLC